MNIKQAVLGATITAVLAILLTTQATSQTVIYVDDDAPPGGDGSTGETAYRLLPDALAEAAASGGGVADIRVAQRVYTPDTEEANPLGTGVGGAIHQLVVRDLTRTGLPLAFVQNQGQWDYSARFVARRGPMVARFEQDAIVLRLEKGEPNDRATSVVVKLAFEGACDDVALEGAKPQSGRYNFLLGNDQSKWRTGVPAYSEVLYRGLYDGVDLRVHERAGQLEYDLLLVPGADLSQVVICCEGIEGLDIDAEGALVMHTALGPIRQKPPTTWYELPNGQRQGVECRFRKLDETRYGFEVPELDSALALVIDPGLEWSTFLGGSGHDVVSLFNGLAVDGAGGVLVAGRTLSADFPVWPLLGATAYDLTHNSPGVFYDAFVALLDPTSGTNQLVWCTFLGGSADESVGAVSPDGAGGVIVGGRTASADFPTTAGAYDTTHNGDFDAFVARLDPSQIGAAQLVYSTFLGHSAYDEVQDLAVDVSGVMTLVGYTDSVFFPTTPGAYDTTFNGGFDGFVARLDPNLVGPAQLVYSTFLGGTFDEFPTNLGVDGSGAVVVAGETFSPDFPTTLGAYDESFNASPGDRDAFVSRLNLNGLGTADLAASTLLGGSADQNGNAMAVDASGAVTVAGFTSSVDFPVTAGAYRTTHNGPVGGVDAYVSRLNATLSTLLFSTFLGGSLGVDGVNSLALGGSGVVTVAGFTTSGDFPTTPGAFDTTHNGTGDAFVTRLNANLSALIYSTFLGGAGQDVAYVVAADGPGRVAVGGPTSSFGFPTTPLAYDTTYNGGGDGFVARLRLCSEDVNDDGVINVLDLIDLLLCFGQLAIPPCDSADINGDGTVNVLDLIQLLLAFGTACP